MVGSRISTVGSHLRQRVGSWASWRVRPSSMTKLNWYTTTSVQPTS